MSTGDASSLRNSSGEGIYRREGEGGKQQGTRASAVAGNRPPTNLHFSSRLPSSASLPSSFYYLFPAILRLLEISGDSDPRLPYLRVIKNRPRIETGEVASFHENRSARERTRDIT